MINDLLTIPLTTLLSIVVLFLLSRLIGFRQISQLSVFDYINSITIGSIAAQLSISQGINIAYQLTAMVIYGVFTYCFAVFTDHSARARKLLVGKPYILIEDGKMYRNNFKKARIDVEEFLSECRSQGYFDISEIHTALIESNGKISLLPKSIYKQATLKDLSLPAGEQAGISANLILDGCIIDENLKRIGMTPEWLLDCIQKQGITDTKKVFLATYSPTGTLSIFLKVTFKETLNAL